MTSRIHIFRWLTLIFVLVILNCGGSEPRLVTIEFRVDELICEDCGKTFEARVLELQGIKTVAVNVNDQTAKISFHNQQLQHEQIATHLREFGFTVDGKAGNLGAQKRLPTCCSNVAEDHS